MSTPLLRRALLAMVPVLTAMSATGCISYNARTDPSVGIGSGAAPDRTDARDAHVGLVGTWTLVRAVDVTAGGTDYYGPNPKGRLIFDNGGRYTLLVLRSDLPIYSPKDKGTPEENRQVVAGSISNYGRYCVAGDVLRLSVEGSSYRQWEVRHGPGGSDGPQPRPFTLNGDELTYTVSPSSNNGVARFVWRREPQHSLGTAP